MLSYPQIDPIAFSLGPLQVHWYGLMYILAFATAWLLGRYRAGKPGSGWTKNNVDDIATWAMLGVIIGARLGYVLFYDLQTYLADPMEILRVWHGGMSFHGGLIGVLLVAFIWAKSKQKRFLDVTDFLAPLAPLGLLFGRIANFINAELWGNVTTMPWGMVFPYAGDLPRHPTQLYEAGLEGLLLFLILWWFSCKPKPIGAVSGVFAVLYSIFRIAVEFFRVPDAQLGYLYLNWVTMGQILCLPLLLVGLLLLVYAYKESKNPSRNRVVLEDGTVLWVKRKK